MAHEHVTFDACETCLTFGIVVRTRKQGKTMHLASEFCPACEGLGFRRDTEYIINVPDDEDEEVPGPPPDGRPIWDDPAVSLIPGCRYCLGAEVVAHLPEDTGIMVVAPCPACRPKSST